VRGVDLEVVVTPGLGDNSYLVVSEREAAVLDPQRDVDRFLSRAEERGVPIRTVLETHVHNDYLSGAVEIRHATGAEIAAPSGGRYGFEHRSLADGDEVVVGGVRLVAIATPGHTPEHLAYLAYEVGADAPTAVFTGGSLMVGGAGRTDLLGPDRTDRLTRDQYRSLGRLAALPDMVQVLPTHGAGSFCGAAGPASVERVSTMAEERLHNAALAAPDEESFIRRQLQGLLAYPAYYRSMAPINRSGPRVLGLGLPEPPALEPADVARLMEAGVWLVDGRRRRDFAPAHVPGSVNVELADDFGSYVGWVIPFGAPVMLIVAEPEDQRLTAAVRQLVRIGYDRIEGYLAGGIEAWRTDGRPLRSYPMADVQELCARYHTGPRPAVLDVRQPVEWDRGHIPGSRHLFVGDLPQRLHQIPRGGEQWIICATGHRASLAASLLDREGIDVTLVAKGGVEDWLAECADEDSAGST
jgi:hydroxyacylglutathione hydrolase